MFLIAPIRHEDHRGWFQESYKMSDFLEYGIPPFVQENAAYSSQNVLRGLHYQLVPHAQGKLVMVVAGAIWDVAVDLRLESPAYKQWIGKHLSEDNGRILYIPPGCAHGYYVLSEKAYVIYKVTAEYCPDTERGIRWNDLELNISWPMSYPILSKKDQDLPCLKNAEYNFNLKGEH